jgi:uncharacterized Zn-finger protein
MLSAPDRNSGEVFMASGPTPHFHNDMGVPQIEIGSKEFMCIGALPPQDHPHVFIDMGDEVDAVCPYCSTHYRHDPTLRSGQARPAAAVWREEAA